MNNQIPKSDPFHVGICMAGAVSAGAYTAGVIDYLLEALEAYEKVRGEPGFPKHRIEIPVLGGASAGGMTAIITGAALQRGITHVKAPLTDILAERPENLLYHSWVDLTNEDMFSEMLKIDDINEGKVVSAFNCKFIDEIAKRALQPENKGLISWKGNLPDFFPGRVELFVTLTNLEGFGYDVPFVAAATGNNHPYRIQIHNDYACFELTNEDKPLINKGWLPLNVQNGLNTEIATQAAMATGAFPMGLEARTVSRPKDIVNNIPFFDEKTQTAIATSKDPYISLNVDGGMINNEPFDKVRERLKEISGQKLSSDYENFEKFNSTVLMIAPFPSTKPKAIGFSAGLLNIIGLTLSAMLGQMRSKPSEIKNAFNSDFAGQFLIDPSREFYDKYGNVIDDVPGEKAVACGALGGFSGFLNKEFRIHDYFLGRYNCKIFLRDYFTIPDNAKNQNPIFRDGYMDINDKKYRSTKPENGWQIIPLVEEKDFNFPKIVFSSGKNWPEQDWFIIEKFRKGLKNRIGTIILNIVKLSPFKKILLWIGTKLLLQGMIANAVLKTIKEELSEWNLLKIIK
jgi:hypothetical protein